MMITIDAAAQLKANVAVPFTQAHAMPKIVYTSEEFAARKVAQIFSTGYRGDHPALFVMLGAVHGDKHGERKGVLRIADGNGRFRGKNIVGGIHLDDFCIAGD